MNAEAYKDMLDALKSLREAKRINETPDVHIESIREAWREAWIKADQAINKAEFA